MSDIKTRPSWALLKMPEKRCSFKLIETIVNSEDGLESVIMDGDGGGEYNYRVVNRDSDADETYNVIFTRTQAQARRHANQFCFGGAPKLKKSGQCTFHYMAV